MLSFKAGRAALRSSQLQAFSLHRSKSHWKAMSTTAAPKLHQFLVYAPDKTDEGCFQRRMKVRSAHLEGAKALHDSGKIKLGGAFLTPESVLPDSTEKKLIGSLMIFEAATIEEVKKIIESDIYYTSDVWDPEKIAINPLAMAVA